MDNVNVERYNDGNRYALKSMRRIIDNVNAREGQTKFPLVLDVGCGSGNATLDLADSIKFEKLIGLDIDDKMIEYAKQHHNRDDIDYLQCDIQSPWEQLNEDVKQLEGRCSLLVSNFALNWVTDIKTCVDNLNRFLSPGATMYLHHFSISALLNMHEMEDDVRRKFEEAMPLMKDDEYVKAWRTAMAQSGLKVVEFQEKEHFTIHVHANIDTLIIPMRRALIKQHVRFGDPEAFVEKYKDLIYEHKYRQVKMIDQLDEKGRQQSESWYKALDIVAIKS